ncbi:hypothetical protein AB0F03_12840 [Streptomyces sp. NPDC028722]|uniref:hypothetical protein n=1 Tax=Streptomyces sp. NPDC028722 TaxID=3155016 RepID=UPI0033CC8A98
MAPCLRLALRCVRLLLFLAAAALPAYGATVAYGATSAHAGERGPVRPSAPGHRDQRGPALPGAAAPGLGHPGGDEPGGDGPGHGRPGHGLPGSATAAALGPAPGVRDPDPPAGEPPAAVVPMPSDSASASVRPSVSARLAAEPSRAGSRAGEGRIRPGRPDGPAAEVEGDEPDTEAARAQERETADVPDGTPTASPPPEEAGLDPARPSLRPAARQAVQQGEGPTEPVLRILPLGTGLVLIGLGLALALLGLRLRRT